MQSDLGVGDEQRRPDVREQVAEWQQRAADTEAPLFDDHGVAEVLPRTSIIVRTGGSKTAALAARRGFGVLFPSVADHAKNRPAGESYRDAGGTGPMLAPITSPPLTFRRNSAVEYVS